MRFRINFAVVAIARLALVALLVSGCASVTPQGDRTLAQQSSGDPVLTLANSLQRPTRPVPVPGTADLRLPVIYIPADAPAAPAIDLTSDSEDIFQRMRNGFSMPDINNDLVLYQQQWYMNRPDYLRRMVERSRLYLYHIVDELDKRGMPMELALLPMVESAYNPMAYSRAKASGLWQFIPATGKRYKLGQDWWSDERRDIVASTSAALDYLQSIYEMHGDWHLALASYNWGEGAVARAVSKNRALDMPTDYLSLSMPRETRNYVPKLQALKNIFSSPALMAQLEIPAVPNRPYFGTVVKTANIDVKVAAKLAEMPVEDFVALNPAHNRPVIKSDTPLVLPANKVETFMNNLEAHESSNKPLSAWRAYTMRAGDKLEKIAAQFGMSVANLKAVNGIKGRLKLSPGFTLLVAGKSDGVLPDMSALPEQPRLPDADLVPTKAGATYRVRKGETLPSIAKRYGTTVAELKRLNHLRSDQVKAGMRLAVAAPAGKSTAKGETRLAKTDAAPAKPAASTAKKTRITYYTIRIGDTLASIARQFKVAAADLLRWNRVSPNGLRPGTTLTIQLAQNP